MVVFTLAMDSVPLYVAPLCPAGHLPHKGGDQSLNRRAFFRNVDGSAEKATCPISPLVGEMSGRTEGGAKGRDRSRRIMVCAVDHGGVSP
jgi:hypothetical protein